MKHILSSLQFEQEEIAHIFAHADFMRDQAETNRRELAQRHLGYIASTIFYEASTRTRKSFEAAAVQMGMGSISTENAKEFSSAVKGEIIEDTIRTEGKYADILILRHDETGAAERAAAVCEVPLINAGDGEGEHPTQALLDLYTIQKEVGRTDDLRVVIGGDLVKGRTARSLSLLLSHYQGNHIKFVSLPELSIGDDIKKHLAETGTSFEETDDMYSAIHHADVVYWTRLQLERRNDGEEELEDIPAISLERNFVIGQAALQTMEDDTIIMHPLPRNNEIELSVDADPRARYFDQVANGKFIRMALLDMLIEQNK